MCSPRRNHYLLLIAAMALLTLPNLGASSLWDVDEGVNAEAAREMREAGTVLTPLFNFELRTAKPVLLYWLQMASYSAFGVNEFAARFPSVLAGLATVLLVYELARSMFGASAGLLAGIVLASAIEFCVLAHAATPDSTLLLFTVLTFYFFWIGSRDGGRSWFLPCGVAAGLAMMTKGPVGLVMPTVVIFLYFLWNRELRRLLDRRVVYGFLMFLLVAAPWYVLVTVETRGVWFKQFIAHENIERFSQPLDEHRGPIFYHLACILILFAPWSILLFATVRNAIREARRQPAEDDSATRARQAARLALCWLGAYLLFFSLAATKLPNYILPVYPALAIMTARLLDRWRTGDLTLARWVMPTAIACLAAIGVFTVVGLTIVAGWAPIPGMKLRPLPALGNWFWIGLIPIAGAITSWRYLRRQQRHRLVGCFVATAVTFVALLAAFPATTCNEFKAPRALIAQAGIRQPHRDIRLLSLHWSPPSVVFYSQREVECMTSAADAVDYLAMSHPVYLFVPESIWTIVQAKFPTAGQYRTVGRQYDFQKNGDILVVTNQ